MGVFGITLTDGAVDLKPTILKSITFGVNSVAQNVVARYALFNGNALIAGTDMANPGTNTITFNGLSITAAEGGPAVILTLRVSFYQTSPAVNAINDHDRMTFTLAYSDVTLDCGGVSSQVSSFSTLNSSTSLHHNHLSVTADRLVFGTQPTDVSTGAAMTPAVTINGVDVNGRLDTDFTGNISLSSTGTMTGDPLSATASAGVATFSTIIHTVPSPPNYFLTATYSSFTAPNNSVTSNPFNVTEIVYVNGDYRTTGTPGTYSWLSNQASPAIWERRVAGSWQTSNSPAYNTSNNVYITNGFIINSGGGFGSSVNLKIMDGAVFNVEHSSTSGSVYIYLGGTLNVNAALTNVGNLEVEDGANLVINISYGNGTENTPIALFNGVEIFHPSSNLTLKKWDGDEDYLMPNNTAISTNTFNGYEAAFGNIICDFNGVDINGAMLFCKSGVSKNLAHGDLIFRTPSTTASYRQA